MAGPAYIDSFRLIRILPDDVIIAADAVDDTLTLVAGPGISLVANSNNDQLTIVNTNPAQFSLGVAGDDSSIKVINSGEIIKFAGAQNVTVSADSEGAITITGPDLSGYLTSETDPVFTASPANGITNTNISNWDAAYSWGDHSVAGYLTSVLNDITVGSIRINTNVIRTVDSNADLELRTSGTGAVLVEAIAVNGTNIDSADSSAITVTPDVVFQAGVTVGNHIVPSSNENIDLGSASFRFRDLYLSGSTIRLGNATITSSNNSNLELAASGSGIVKALDYFELSDGTSPEGEWTNFTPTWTASTSNPAIGDGLIEGRYKQVGKTVHVWMSVSMGSTTTFGTGEYKVNLPVPARMISSVVLDLVMRDDGTRHYNSLAHNDYTTGPSLNNTSVTLFWDTGVVTESAPFTWADGDYFIISGTYEAS
jgi:hypothetical protein